MATSFTSIPYRGVNSADHDGLHNDYLRVTINALIAAVNALEDTVDELVERKLIVVSTAEPTHDGSQVDGDIWVKKV